MGYFKHHAIIVTGWRDEMDEIHRKAKEVFEKTFENDPYDAPHASRLVSEIVDSLSNGTRSFFIAPDGSKSGWATSNNADKAREEFLDWLKKSYAGIDYVEIYYGGDDEHQGIYRSNNTDMKK
ncbi:MAG: hypothetical protein R3A50_09900 [Saprospiraceae bacterium]